MTPPIRACKTCMHKLPHPELSKFSMYDICDRFKTSCSIAIAFRCGSDLSYWAPVVPVQPTPPGLLSRVWRLFS